MTFSPALLLALTAAFWSIGGFLIKGVALSPLAVTGWRSLIAGIALLLVYRRIPRLRNRIEALGVVAYALVVISFVTATKLSTSANAIFLQSTAPLYVGIIGALWLKEKLTFIDILSFIGVAIGMSLFFSGQLSEASRIGNLYGLASGFFFALFILCMRREAHGAPLEVIIYGNFFTAVVALSLAPSIQPTGTDMRGLLLLGTLQLALPYFLYTKAMPHVRAFEASLIFLLEPILNPIWTYLAIGEQPALASLVGGALVLTSITLRSFSQSFLRRRARRRSS